MQYVTRIKSYIKSSLEIKILLLCFIKFIVFVTLIVSPGRSAVSQYTRLDKSFHHGVRVNRSVYFH